MKKFSVYVVTRDGRRIEEENYPARPQAVERANQLKAMLKDWDPAGVSRVAITKTNKPKRIR